MSESTTDLPRPSALRPLGVYSFDPYETVILAALVTEDPLLLIGASGTGKTFLLNSLSEALGLEHRHYNASLISFDDLIGFPYPDEGRSEIRFLQTPATVWGAESVLVDEISRCKPEHQNRLFSLVHERRIQGIRLERLRYRWAAMNPCSNDQGPDDGYAGSEPLDPALADRFALIVSAADWSELTEEDQRRVAHPGGEGAIADDGGALRAKLATWRGLFIGAVEDCPPAIVDYATAAVSTLNASAVRISPRRARYLTRSLLAAELVTGRRVERVYESILRCSIPQEAWGARVEKNVIALAHRTAWDLSMATPKQQWLHRFHLERTLAAKLEILLERCPDADTGTQAVCELIAREPQARAAAFAFAVYPAAVSGLSPIGREGVNDLGRIAVPILAVDGEVRWQERLNESGTTHPELTKFARVMNKLKGARLERARQFFSHCAVAGVPVDDPVALEKEIEECVKVVRRHRSASC